MEMKVEEDMKALQPSGGDSLCLQPRDLRFLVNLLKREDDEEEQGDRVSDRVRSSEESAKNDRCSKCGRDCNISERRVDSRCAFRIGNGCLVSGDVDNDNDDDGIEV